MNCLLGNLRADDTSGGTSEILHERMCIFHAPAQLRASLRQMAQAEKSSGNRDTLVLIMPEVQDTGENWPNSLLSAILDSAATHPQDLNADALGDNLLEQLSVW